MHPLATCDGVGMHMVLFVSKRGAYSALLWHPPCSGLRDKAAGVGGEAASGLGFRLRATY